MGSDTVSVGSIMLVTESRIDSIIEFTVSVDADCLVCLDLLACLKTAKSKMGIRRPQTVQARERALKKVLLGWCGRRLGLRVICVKGLFAGVARWAGLRASLPALVSS